MELSKEQRSIVALSLVPDVGPRRFRNLLDHFGSAFAALSASRLELCAVEEISPSLAHAIKKVSSSDAAEREIERAAKDGIAIHTYDSEHYPASLKVLTDYPPVLYVRGELKASDEISVALVGTRQPTPYGINVAEVLARELSQLGITTVSGLARGIDTRVHTATLAAHGRTIAVLGNGLHRHYPPENRKLEDRIASQGALVSEFSLDTDPDKGNFPRRNRLISGMALAVVVVESDLKSGALVTARCAAEQGKDVFAVPGSIFSRFSRGPHYLAKSGAHLIQSTFDIIEELEPLTEWLKRKAALRPSAIREDMPLQDAKQKTVVTILERNPGGVSIDSLARQLGSRPGELASALLDLEMKGMIRSLPGKMYVKKY